VVKVVILEQICIECWHFHGLMQKKYSAMSSKWIAWIFFIFF